MKRVLLTGILVCFLAGCSSGNTELERGMALRTRLLQAASCSFDVDITADYGEKIHTFSMSCQGDDKGDLTFTVTAPETISGITGKIAQEKGALTFGDKALAFELLADDQLSPVSAPWILLKTLRSGYLTSAGMDGDWLRLTIDDSYEDDALQLDIWLDQQELPKRAEILYDGRRILSLDVKAFVIV